ncbi:MAG: hypothetical protein PHS41_10950 [Victivallaceae bacterium]|nr:hypothetical protein [Victivallaceae bacterium]
MNDKVNRSLEYTISDAASNFSINFSGMKFTAADLDGMKDKFAAAAREMANLEAGAVKNPDEHRKVTHFTDRKNYIGSALFEDVERFAEAVRTGAVKGETGKKFTAAVVNGIGGSALGPQLMQFAINGPYWNEFSDEKRNGYLKLYFLDNTDSAGFADLLAVMDPASTLQLTISKSGGTQETTNNLTALENIYKAQGLHFGKHAVSITMKGSKLEAHSLQNNFLKIFEMAESIGGRTSETSIVGHLPAALCGINFQSFLEGACHMDELTRNSDYTKNPAGFLAAMWYIAGKGRGDRNMVIVPYCDRLVLLSRYLQQLVMESLGKELDLDGKTVHQGLSVFGNKGGTDAHAFIQQLNDGRDDFFVTFIEVLENAMQIPLTGNLGMGDYLHGFQEGLTSALTGKGRQVISVELAKLDEFNLGMVIALYERAVAIYAEFIHINAFHQPGVQSYKLAAKGILTLRDKMVSGLKPGMKGTALELAGNIGEEEHAVELGRLLDKAAFNCPCVSRSFDAAKGQWIYTVNAQ